LSAPWTLPSGIPSHDTFNRGFAALDESSMPDGEQLDNRPFRKATLDVPSQPRPRPAENGENGPDEPGHWVKNRPSTPQNRKCA
jgi:hypothetical protein